MAEKKYVIGYAFGKEYVMWDDVTNWSEELDPDTGLTVISFDEDGVHYVYKGNERRGFKEQNNLSPSVTSLKLIGRRTARRHSYFDKSRLQASPRTEPTENDDPIITRGRRVRLANDSGYAGCGGEPEYYEISGCGGSSVYRRGSCGSWQRVTGDGTCGAVSTSPYYGDCGGGHC